MDRQSPACEIYPAVTIGETRLELFTLQKPANSKFYFFAKPKFQQPVKNRKLNVALPIISTLRNTASIVLPSLVKSSNERFGYNQGFCERYLLYLQQEEIVLS